MAKENKSVVVQDVPRCPRCRGAHPELAFRPFGVPLSEWNFWAQCPVSKEPMMAKVALVIEGETVPDSQTPERTSSDGQP